MMNHSGTPETKDQKIVGLSYLAQHAFGLVAFIATYSLHILFSNSLVLVSRGDASLTLSRSHSGFLPRRCTTRYF